MAYTTKAKTQEYIGKTITQSDSQVTEWIAGVKAFIDKLTGRVFEADSTNSDRLFVGTESPALLIDDCVSISKVYAGDTYGESFTEKTNFLKFPLNASAQGKPYTKVVLRENWGVGIHKITAKWGYSTSCPADITFVATVLLAGIINQALKSDVKSESIGDYSVSYADEKGLADFNKAMSILDAYKKIRL